jgi:hypothetical protein
MTIRRLLDLPTSAQVLADKIYDLSVQYFTRGHAYPEPIRKAFLSRIELLEQDLKSQTQVRPLTFRMGRDPFASLMPESDNRAIRSFIAETRLSRLLINVTLVRLVKFDQKPCFVFYRPHRPTTIGCPLPYTLPSGVLKISDLIHDALQHQPILNLNWTSEDQMQRACDRLTWLEIRAFRSQGCRIEYVGETLRI